MPNDLSVYYSVKDQMKTGDLLQWHSNSIIGTLIRAKIKSTFNHSGLVLRLSEYEGLERRRWTSEALEHGVYPILLSRRLEDFDGQCWWFPLKPEWDEKRKKIGEYMVEKFGVPYDYESIFKQLISHVSADARSLFCSEYCYLSYGFDGDAPNPSEMLDLGIFKEGTQLI